MKVIKALISFVMSLPDRYELALAKEELRDKLAKENISWSEKDIEKVAKKVLSKRDLRPA